MCGVIAAINVDQQLIDKVVEESKVRGLHYLGYAKLGKAVLYHTRYCTSGKDNQPIDWDGSFLAMNGVIHMGTKKEMEKYYSIKMGSDNDAEVLAQYLDSYSFEELCVMWPKVSIAAVLLNKKKLWAFRNKHRPLWLIEKQSSVLIASTQDILKRAGADWRKARLLKPQKIYSWTI